MHASLNVGYQGKSGPGKIHEVILVLLIFLFFFDTGVAWKAFMHLPYITGDFTTKLYKKNG